MVQPKASQAESDEALLTRIAKGDNRAIEQLYDRYGRAIYSFVLRMLANTELAEEVVQETFWRVWRRSQTYQQSRGQVSSWLFGIAHNLAIDELRRQRSQPSLVSDQGEEPVLNTLVAENADVVETALEREQQQIIRSALARLPAEQREAIELAYFNGMSQSEIADALQSPLGTIKTRIRRGLLALRGMIRQDTAEPLLDEEPPA